MSWYYDGLARLLRYGLQPSEYKTLRPGQAREILIRLEQAEDQEERAKLELQGKQIEALMSAIGEVVKAVNNNSKLMRDIFSKRPTL